MAALTANSVTYTALGKGPGVKDDNSVRQTRLKIVFGDGASTYPAGGIPLTNLSKWGFPNSVADIILEDASNADGYLYKVDLVNKKLRIYQSPASAGLAALTEATTSFVPASNVTMYIQVRGH